jgi:hypothetical protein
MQYVILDLGSLKSTNRNLYWVHERQLHYYDDLNQAKKFTLKSAHEYLKNRHEEIAVDYDLAVSLARKAITVEATRENISKLCNINSSIVG